MIYLLDVGKGRTPGCALFERHGRIALRPGWGALVMPNEDAMLDPNVYEGLAGFRFALRQFLAFSEGVTQAAGVTPRQYQALLVIQTQPGRALPIGALAEQMLMSHHGAVQLIDRLVAAGLVERRHSETDRRSVLVRMTDKGLALLEQLAAAHIEALLAREPLLAESLRRLREIGRRGGEVD